MKNEKLKIKNLAFLLIFILLSTVHCPLSTVLLAQETKAKSALADADEPIYVTSDKVEYREKMKEGEFTGNVKVIQGRLTLTSLKLTVLFDNDGKKINQIVAVGSVKVTRDDMNITSENAVFYNGEQKIVLTGKPQVVTRDNKFSGEKITVFLKEDRILIDSKVKGYLIPKK